MARPNRGTVMAHNDTEAAETTYISFITMAKWGTLAIVIVATFVVLLIS